GCIDSRDRSANNAPASRRIPEISRLWADRPARAPLPGDSACVFTGIALLGVGGAPVRHMHLHQVTLTPRSVNFFSPAGSERRGFRLQASGFRLQAPGSR